MIYITGDTHGDFERFGNRKLASRNLNLTEKDYVIVCGDFGLGWKNDGTFKYDCKFLAGKPFTILWIQGNHENYDMIKEFPLEEWHGGKVRHIIQDKVILLERGQIFEIEGKTFFTFGGAASHDVQGGILDRNDIDFAWLRKKAISNDLPFRIVGESWWKEEIPSEEEMSEGRRNLEAANNRVDYIITHCCATHIQEAIKPCYEADVLTEYFKELEEVVQYKHWYFGHYHDYADIGENHTLIYREIVPIED